MPSRPDRTGPLLLAGLLVAAAIGSFGCGPRYVRSPVLETPVFTVKLRAEKARGGVRDRGFSHPVSIAGIRLAHIFSRIDVRLPGDEGERRGAIPTEMLFELGDAVSAALAAADSSQEVSVQALRRERSLGLFTNRYYTSLLVWVKGDELYVHLSRSDDLLAKDEEDDLNEARVGFEVQSFKVIAADSIRAVGSQTVAVDWRDPRFREASHLRVDERGQVRRRQVLMEGEGEPEEEEIVPGEPPVPTDPLPDDPAILRALADLEEDRREGRITEVEYRSRREDLLGSAGR